MKSECCLNICISSHDSLASRSWHENCADAWEPIYLKQQVIQYLHSFVFYCTCQVNRYTFYILLSPYHSLWFSVCLVFLCVTVCTLRSRLSKPFHLLLLLSSSEDNATCIHMNPLWPGEGGRAPFFVGVNSDMCRLWWRSHFLSLRLHIAVCALNWILIYF